MKTRFYLASAGSYRQRARTWMSWLEEIGARNTLDWTESYDCPEEDLQKCAYMDLAGVAACEWFILLYPPLVELTGAWVELGYALALNKKIVILNESEAPIDLAKNIFLRLNCLQIVNDELEFCQFVTENIIFTEDLLGCRQAPNCINRWEQL